MNQNFYLDASALMRRAESGAVDSTPRNRLIAPVVNRILADPSNRVACSETTLLEFHNNITLNTRKLQTNSTWTTTWWEQSRLEVYRDIAEGRLMVIPPPKKSAEHVMSLVTIATQRFQRGLRAWDALHVVTAASWAYDLDERVSIVTSDDDFDVSAVFDDFGGRITIFNVDVQASTGEGSDRDARP